MVLFHGDRTLARAAAYLAIPADYCSDLGGVRWSASADALEFADGSTFAFAAEVVRFLEGFASQRPLIPFGCVVRLLHLLRPRPETPASAPAFVLLRSAFRQSRGDLRAAGAFAARLCRDVPPAPDPPAAEDLGRWLLTREVGVTRPPAGGGEVPPLAPPAFEARIERVLDGYDFAEMAHWLRHGCAPPTKESEKLAEAAVQARPPTLGGVLAELARRERLSGAVPFVSQLVSALTLPPRRLSPPELPLGGYADVTTRGHLEQILPSQLAYDDLEFVRRLAQRELLFFRREDPHVRTREDLVVLLDQGVRTWGVVRLVLTAAAFALGRLAERRRIPLFLASTSGGGRLHDPLTVPSAELGDLLEASDLGANPGLALERVLEAEAKDDRDVVLLTHPRNLVEPDVSTAARRVRPGTRLFAVAVDGHGQTQVAELRHGAPVSVSRFRLDLNQPPTLVPDPAAGTAWRGDVEPVPYPFVFGIGPASGRIQFFDFDHAAEWLLAVTADGLLLATRTDGSRTEALPRGRVGGQDVSEVHGILGVAGGFVVTARSPALLALHYDFTTRTCKAHFFDPAPEGKSGVRIHPVWHYLRWAHTLVLQQGSRVEGVHLSTGSKQLPAEIRGLCGRGGPGDGPGVALRLPVQDRPPGPGPWSWPWLAFAPDLGQLTPMGVNPEWEPFIPLSDGQPVLRGAELLGATCQGRTLAVLFRKPNGNVARLWLFRGPEGVPLAMYQQPHALRHAALSADGRLLARQANSAEAEVREVRGGPPVSVTPRGGYHHDADVILGGSWLSICVGRRVHLARWDGGQLRFQFAHGKPADVLAAAVGGASASAGRRATQDRVTAWLQAQGSGRFRAAAWGQLTAAVDRFGQVALFGHGGALVCMVFTFRQEIAAWMPDGTCLGPVELLGRPSTPGAAERIGRALSAAWDPAAKEGV
jgi:hypothetical protein